MIANVKIEQDKEYNYIHRVYINGDKVENVTGINFISIPETIPKTVVAIGGAFGFEGASDVSIEQSSNSIREAFNVIRNELLNYGATYMGFSACVKSAISEFFGDESSKNWIEDELTEAIMKRIIGKE